MRQYRRCVNFKSTFTQSPWCVLASFVTHEERTWCITLLLLSNASANLPLSRIQTPLHIGFSHMIHYHLQFGLIIWTFNKNSDTSINFRVWIYNRLCWATSLFNCKSIWEWITMICTTHSREDIPKCHFHLNLLNKDYWRCGAPQQRENSLHNKVLAGQRGLQ